MDIGFYRMWASYIYVWKSIKAIIIVCEIRALSMSKVYPILLLVQPVLALVIQGNMWNMTAKEHERFDMCLMLSFSSINFICNLLHFPQLAPFKYITIRTPLHWFYSHLSPPLLVLKSLQITWHAVHKRRHGKIVLLFAKIHNNAREYSTLMRDMW